MKNKNEENLDNPFFVASLRAMGASLAKDKLWAFRKITREYSIKYNVPLPQVRKMPFTEVLYEVLEGRLDNLPKKNLIENIRDLLKDPESEETAISERMRKYEEEEKQRMATLKTKKPKVKKQKVTALVEKTETILSKKYDLGDPEKE